ncbi:P-loop containing nucleoside triphosphate hydrolase protein, partial [Mycena vitilis]
ATPREEEKPFELTNLRFDVPKGSFVAIVGKVGSGKVRLISFALIGEMRKTSGTVTFGGTIAYVPQTAWIRDATLRQNVIFGQEEDEEKYNARRIIRACNLEHDLEVLPHGERTEIGEKGINLSGGRRYARVSLARAAYSTTDVVLLDDPLSAVDSFVGKAILNDYLLNGPLADRTRILVTHWLHVLDKTDYIYVRISLFWCWRRLTGAPRSWTTGSSARRARTRCVFSQSVTHIADALRSN